jgi:hypothetical protein
MNEEAAPRPLAGREFPDQEIFRQEAQGGGAVVSLRRISIAKPISRSAMYTIVIPACQLQF